MNFAETIPPEYQNYVFVVIAAIIVLLGWQTTYVREERLHPTAVLIIDNNRRRFIDLQATVDAVGRSSSSQSNYSNATEEAEIEVEGNNSSIGSVEAAATTALQSIIDEVNDLAISDESPPHYNQSLHPLEEEIEELIEDIGQRRIIEAMDGPDTAEGLRRRRLAFYENDRTSQNHEGTSTNRRENLNVHPTDQVDNSHAENCTNENNENENISKTEIKPSVVVGNGDSQPEQQANLDNRDDEFRIKLKYLNDELRLVKGTPNEAIGDFKKRNFTVELAAEKLVRLVFNGHVLQPDSKTLRACGLFDNCVVHCLVHNKKPSVNNDGDNNNATQDETSSGQATLGAETFSDRTSGGVAFIYLGMAFIVLAMVFCWYCRFQYGHLFSWYSTTGLVLMTAIFLIIFPIIILIERGVTT